MSLVLRVLIVVNLSNKCKKTKEPVQSQSKLLGQFAIFLPSQCWCARFDELNAITIIGRTRKSRRARSEKTALGGSIPTIFI